MPFLWIALSFIAGIAAASELDRKLLKIAWQEFSMLMVFGDVDAAELLPAVVVYLAKGDMLQYERFPPQLLVVDGLDTGNKATTLSTLQQGWITLTTEGRQMWVEEER